MIVWILFLIRVALVVLQYNDHKKKNLTRFIDGVKVEIESLFSRVEIKFEAPRGSPVEIT